MHVDDLRLPLPPRVLHHARFDHVEHVAVAVVVVADILLVELRHRRDLERRADVAAIPLRHHLLAVRVDGRPQQQDDVLEDVRRTPDRRPWTAGRRPAAWCAAAPPLRSNAGRRRCGRSPCPRAPAAALRSRSGPPDAPAGARSRDSDRSSPGSPPMRSQPASRSGPASTSPRASSSSGPMRRPASGNRRRSRRRSRPCDRRRPCSRGRIPERAARGPGRRRAAGRSARQPPAGWKRHASRHSSTTLSVAMTLRVTPEG